MTEESNMAEAMNAQPTGYDDVSTGRGSQSTGATAASATAPQDRRRSGWKQKALIIVLGVIVLAAFIKFGFPWIDEMVNTVSTDDAYVNGHVTFVAPRIAGQISRVLVDDNNRVRKGDIIAKLDQEPYLVAVSEKQAVVDTARANLQAAIAGVRAIEAQARSRRWNLQHAVQDVDNQIALLHARVAGVDKSKAVMALAQLEFNRVRELLPKADVSREVYDQRQAELTTASAEFAQSLAEVYQVRASLGLPAQPVGGGDLSKTPPDLDETFSKVLEAQAELIQSAAQLGVVHSFDQGPKAMIEQFERLGDINATFTKYAANAPAVKQAEANLEAAERDLAQAELNLRYCDVVAAIGGVVTRRNVNPGDYVQPGQNLMAICSLEEIWVDANFKETQLRDLRIGQPVDLYVDMYGDRRIFKGRVSGFTMGTGSTLALLPPENATGNFIKVVQRLPVRIDLVDYDADRTPLFIGSSVVPYVYFKKPPTGPNAGKFLQADAAQSVPRGAAVSASGERK